jgi:predicted nucleic acid-binding protein
MQVIIDTNIVFSSLLSGNHKFHSLLFNDELELAAPNFIFIELFKHKEKILKHSKLSNEELLDLFGLITERINFIPASLLRRSSFEATVIICKDIP